MEISSCQLWRIQGNLCLLSSFHVLSSELLISPLSVQISLSLADFLIPMHLKFGGMHLPCRDQLPKMVLASGQTGRN